MFGCIVDKGAVSISGKKKATTTTSRINSASISSVQIINNQLVITGTGLTAVTNIKVSGNSLNKDFNIESQSGTQIIANSLSVFSFDVSKVFNLILSDANASATFPIDFSICNSTLNGKSFNCSITAMDKDVLSYDAVSGTWKPRAATGTNYLGAFNASANPPAPTPSPFPASGSYYIVSADGMIGATSFVTGDWLISNGTAWQKIGNSTLVTSVFSRTGNIVAQEGDYDLDKLTDVDLSVAPISGKVLKFNGTHWVAADDLSAGGAGSVVTASIADSAVTDAKIVTIAASKITGTINSTQILDGTIVNADINAAAAIDYSKLNIPAAAIPYAKLNIANGDIPYAKLNIANGEIPAAKISGLPAATDILTTSIINSDTTHAPDADSVFDALLTKLNLIGGGTISLGTINGIPTPSFGDDVANKSYVDTQIPSVIADSPGISVWVPANSIFAMKVCPGTWTDVGVTGAGPNSATCDGVTCRVCQSPATKGLMPASSVVLMESCPYGWAPLGIVIGPGSAGLNYTYQSCQSPGTDSKIPQNAKVIMKTCPTGWSDLAMSGGPLAATCSGTSCHVCETPGNNTTARGMVGGAGGVTGTGGEIFIKAGAGGTTSGPGGDVNITSGATTEGVAAGAINLTGGIGAGAANGGSIKLSAGTASGTGALGTILLNPTNAGFVGIGTLTPAYTLDVVGGVNASSGYTSVSDRRLKKNIVTIDDALIKVLGLRGVEFDWKKNDEHEIGLIAQEVEAIVPTFVKTGTNGFKAVKYSNIVALLIEAMKTEHKQVQKNLSMMNTMQTTLEEHSREIASLEEENVHLKKENADIKIRLSRLEKVILQMKH
ncbi:tail fiber domain-containing protein [Bacteriovorax sp. PP10]|uniref:Tail fiber domain-containing protein n=1 Tax=Bacteriovorax antarcticus TaxID=3088717 RepID=A0ABU5VTD3_9BACT|nr:tail fiber domain-containing protein [Bacteriovorax sp. PP10]MEA9354915.1 tail fiber domain-containing protein [Bacteriovorax sp. PP10]